MKKVKFLVLASILILSALNACNKDDEPAKPNLFSYGLLGVSPLWVENDTGVYEKSEFNYNWVYIRVFGHPDYQNVEAELSLGENIIPLEADNQFSDIYFTEGRSAFSFSTGENYGVRIWDSENEYSGTITTLSRLTITSGTIESYELNLEWTDIGADFYDVEFYNSGSEEHFQTEETEITIDLDEVAYNAYNYTDITVAGFKGFSPSSAPSGNINGCYGYLFGYSDDDITIEPGSGTFIHRPRNTRPDLDSLIISFFNSSDAMQQSEGEAELEYTFTYGYLYNYSQSRSENNYFSGVTLTEPANAVTLFRTYLDGKELETYNWSGFYHTIFSQGKVYESYDRNDVYTFKLKLNDQTESAEIAPPDTFSIVSGPPEDQIPSAPFEIRWREPYNAEYYFIDANWQVEGDSIDKNYYWVTEDNQFIISQVPDNALSGYVSVVAVNGSNPMHALEPNLEELNGYVYSRRYCYNTIYFNNQGKKTTYRITGDSPGIESFETGKRLDNYIISALAERNPGLERHKQELLQQINRK